uniref:Rab9 effector protein with kelch motifs n=1 Tax=Otus sunia TaxID=257818 RepID=A0A8C8E561_9STRI
LVPRHLPGSAPGARPAGGGRQAPRQARGSATRPERAARSPGGPRRAPGAGSEAQSCGSRCRAPSRWLLPGRVFCYRVHYFVNQMSELEIGTWESPEVRGVQPLPRTFHTSSAAVGDCLYVFGGGDKGAEPVQDQRLHVFDTATLTWSQPDTHGDPPAPRHGHAVVAVGTKLFIHGGLAGDVFYNDLFCIDINDMRWVKIPATGDIPGGRASHSSAVFRDHVYIFGGIGPEGTLDTTYKYHTEKQQWTLLQFDSPLPARRLDHAMCVVPWQAGESGDTGAAAGRDRAGNESPVAAGDKTKTSPLLKGQEEEEGRAEGIVHLLLVFGGMDTQGEIHRDCVVTLIE